MTSARDGIDRRRFLALGAAASGLAVGACGNDNSTFTNNTPTAMGYRSLGGTGLKVSEIAFGGDGPENPSLLMAAMDAGINVVFTSPRYRDGRAQASIGRAIAELGGRRDELIVFSGTGVTGNTSKQDILDTIDGSLRRLQTDHIEIWGVFQVETPRDLAFDPLCEAFEEARAAGKVGHLGLTGHSGGMQQCLEAAIDDGLFEVFLIKYDFVSYPDQDRILRRASEHGIGTMVFKTGAGNREQEIKDLEESGLSYRQATVRWALTNPDVSSVCIRMTSFSQIHEFVGAVGLPLARAEIEMLRRYAEDMYAMYCRFCRSCEAHCPHGVAVADINRYAMYFKYDRREKDAMELYDRIPEHRSAAACGTCTGHCEEGCPFGRRIRFELVEANRLLRLHEA
jgi:aryl-alcohol dehydrogenase-like predicted oxidoreductase